MNEPPQFLIDPMHLEGEASYRAAPFPYRGLIIAWGAAFLIGVVIFLQKIQSDRFTCLPMVLGLFFLLSAVLISFSHWVDSRTIIHATPRLLRYRSPFRRFQQEWDQITEIKALQAGHSWRVIVIGKDATFSIRVRSNAEHDPSSTEFLALPCGDELIRYICGMADLSEVQKEDEGWICKKRPSPGLV